jgi:hypothetical protein
MQLGTAPGGSAKKSRRGGVRSNGFHRDRRRSWIRPLRRTRRAFDVSTRLIESSCRVIDRCSRFAAEHPLRAKRQLERVSGWVAEANEQLGRGAASLTATHDHVAVLPVYPGDAWRLLLVATTQWSDAIAQLAWISSRLDYSFIVLADYINGGTAPLDLSELLPKERRAPRGICFVVRPPSLKLLSRQNSRVFCIHVRRQRSARITVAEAPRRIVRGRAPPSVSTCSL